MLSRLAKRLFSYRCFTGNAFVPCPSLVAPEIVEIELDVLRNNILRFELLLSISAFMVTLGALVTGELSGALLLSECAKARIALCFCPFVGLLPRHEPPSLPAPVKLSSSCRDELLSCASPAPETFHAHVAVVCRCVWYEPAQRLGREAPRVLAGNRRHLRLHPAVHRRHPGFVSALEPLVTSCLPRFRGVRDVVSLM